MPHGHRDYFKNTMFSVKKIHLNIYKFRLKKLLKATSNDTPQRFAGEIDAEANLET
jgi:hypothetical protein